MKRLRLPEAGIKLGSRFRPQLLVIEYIATKRGDAERGPMLWISPTDARIRLLEDGELAWVQGPRRHELAVVVVDELVPDGSVKLRDIAGVALAEQVTVSKPDLDTEKPERTVG